MSGDGGVDEAEAGGNGIVCSGGTAADDPLCTEQFESSDVASLKVVPEEGYELAYWEMNGGIIQQASAEPLFLSTMPMLAGVVPIPSNTSTATMKAQCLSLSLESVTFEGMSAQIVSDSGDPYPGPNSTPPEPHWKKTDNALYRPTPVVFTSGSTMTAMATFAVLPADFSGTLLIQARGTDASEEREFLFPPTEAVVTSGVASVTIPCITQFPDTTVDIFDPMSVSWSFQTASGRFQEAGVSSNRVYVTLGAPQTFVYHTLVHVGCKNAKGETTEEGVTAKIWEEFTDRNVQRMDGQQLTYYGSYNTKNTTTSALLKFGDGQCGAWAKLFIDMRKVQGIDEQKEYVIFEPIHDRGFLVKDWSFSPTGGTSGQPDYPYFNIPPNDDPLSFIGDNGYVWRCTPEVNDEEGVEGQGNKNPASVFGNHQVVISGEYYDPSYGVKHSSLSAIDDNAIAGYLDIRTNFPVDETHVNCDLNNNGTLTDPAVPVTVILFRKNETGLDLKERREEY